VRPALQHSNLLGCGLNDTELSCKMYVGSFRGECTRVGGPNGRTNFDWMLGFDMDGRNRRSPLWETQKGNKNLEGKGLMVLHGSLRLNILFMLRNLAGIGAA
jgi:hypothetical protein